MAAISGLIRVMEKAARKAGGRMRRDFASEFFPGFPCGLFFLISQAMSHLSLPTWAKPSSFTRRSSISGM